MGWILAELPQNSKFRTFFGLVLLCCVTGGVQAQERPASKPLHALPELALQRHDISPVPPIVFVGISAVAADTRGNLYVLHRPASGDPIVVLDPHGRVLRSWGKGLFAIPHGIRLDPAGNVWTVDANTSVVYKFSRRGRKLLTIDVSPRVGDDAAKFCGATDVAFTRAGHVLVADGYCNARVIEYDARGMKVREWGRRGSGPGEFNVVHSIAVGPGGNVYVADRENGRVQWFGPEGTFLGQWVFGGQVFSLAFTRAGELYVGIVEPDPSGTANAHLLKVDPATGVPLERAPIRAHELAVTRDGALLPATRSSRVVVLRPFPIH